MANEISLTTKDDVVTAPDGSGVTVVAGAGTLNPNDMLTGGAGTDTLKLYNDSFDLSSVAKFTGFEQLALTNANVKLGAQSLNIAASASGSERTEINLGSGTVKVTAASGGLYVGSTGSASWGLRNVVDGGSDYSLVQLNTASDANVTYNLVFSTFKNVDYLTVIGDHATLQANTATFKGVSSLGFYGSACRVTTAAASLDLSQTSVTKASIQSTRTAGTNFLVGDATTGLQVAGGTGQDTVTGKGFAFTSEQRDAIFTLGSIEKIVDTSGTYTAPPPDPNVRKLTAGDDVVTAPDGSGITVVAGPGTLGANDKLTGGAGTDVLKLYNDTFDVASLATFSGFEQLVLNNANVKLGTQSLSVTANASGFERTQIDLGSGTVKVTVGSGDAYVGSAGSTSWGLRNVIDGGSGFSLVQLNTYSDANVTYNLAASTFKNVDYLSVLGDRATLQANAATFKGVSHIELYGSGGRVTTAAASLDLSLTSVTKASIQSTRTAGTNFIVGDANTGLQVAGGTGQDTVTGKGFAFTSEQRDAIFTLGSIEKIVDTSGTYTAPPPANNRSAAMAASSPQAGFTHALFDAAFAAAPPLGAHISPSPDATTMGMLAAHS